VTALPAHAASSTARAERRTVDVRVETFVDASRATPPHPAGTDPGAPNRTLPTTLYVPRGKGPFPLVLFSHGTATDAASYDRLLRRWARAGYVVAAPAYPRTSRLAAGGPDLRNADRDQQPADASFVIDRVLALDSLRDRIDPRRIVAAGHSLGGYITYLLAYGACCRDARVDAAISLAGLGYALGGLADDPAPPPLLLVHAEADEEVPYRFSLEAFRAASGDRWLVTLVGDPMLPHLRPFQAVDDPAARVVTETTLDFLALTVGGKAQAAARLRADARQAGVTTLRVREG
jgi:dienelactone hydrolase